MTRILRSIIGAGLVIAGILVVGLSSAMAANSGNQTVTATVPSSISLTGLSATASGTTPAGASTLIDGGSVTIGTNNGTGYTLKAAAGAANFTGTGGHTFPIADDNVTTCATQLNSCTGQGALTTTGTTIKTTAAPSSDTIWLAHNITLGGSQAADVYSVSITFTATTNP